LFGGKYGMAEIIVYRMEEHCGGDDVHLFSRYAADMSTIEVAGTLTT
jgi:hypothetical protein